MVGSVAGRPAISPITVQTMTNTLTADAEATHRADFAGPKRRASTIVRGFPAPTRPRPAALSAIVKAIKVPIVADIHFHYKARPSKLPRAGGLRACASIPATSASAGTGPRGRQGRPGPRLLHAHRRQCPGRWRKTCSRNMAKPWPGGHGRKAPLDHARNPAGSRLPRVQDQREGVRRLPGGRRLSAGWRMPATIPCISASPRRARCGPGTVKSSIGPGLALVGGDRRHGSRPRCRPSPRKR